MRCQKVQKKLSLLVSADLGRRQRLRIQAHLESCLDCRTEFENLKKALLILRQADQEETQKIPEWDRVRWAELMKKISKLPTKGSLWTGYQYLPAKKYVLRGVAWFAVFLLVLFSYFFVSRFWSSSSRLEMAENRQVSQVEKEASISRVKITETLPPKAQTKKEPDSLAFEIKEKGMLGENNAGRPEELSLSLPDRVELAFSLPESGAQVIWIFDRNFTLEGGKNED